MLLNLYIVLLFGSLKHFFKSYQKIHLDVNWIHIETSDIWDHEECNLSGSDLQAILQLKVHIIHFVPIVLISVFLMSIESLQGKKYEKTELALSSYLAWFEDFRYSDLVQCAL